jgi:DegV family protein with EDD domain
MDTQELDKAGFVEEMKKCEQAGQTACPSPGAWCDSFQNADNIIAITISSKLSGSFNSAQTARMMVLEEHPEKKIFVLDSSSAGPGLALLVFKANEFISEGFEFEEVTTKLEKYVENIHTIFVLDSFDNLIKSGRISKITGYIAGKLNLQGIGIGNSGVIELKQKVRGYRKLIQFLISEIKDNKFIDDKIIISHCQNLEIAEKIRDEIHKIWNDKKVFILETGGLCSYYAENKGIIVAY